MLNMFAHVCVYVDKLTFLVLPTSGFSKKKGRQKKNTKIINLHIHKTTRELQHRGIKLIMSVRIFADFPSLCIASEIV